MIPRGGWRELIAVRRRCAASVGIERYRLWTEIAGMVARMLTKNMGNQLTEKRKPSVIVAYSSVRCWYITASPPEIPRARAAENLPVAMSVAFRLDVMLACDGGSHRPLTPSSTRRTSRHACYANVGETQEVSANSQIGRSSDC